MSTTAGSMPGKQGFIQCLITVLASVMTLSAIAYTLDIPSRLGFSLFTEQFLALVLAFALALAFLQTARAGRGVALSLLFAVLGFGGALYVAAAYPVLVDQLAFKPLDIVVVSIVLGVLTVEAVRRLTGWGLAGVVILFVLYGLYGDPFGLGMGRAIAWDRLFSYIVLDSNGLLGLPLNVSSVMVFAFIILGQLLLVTGGGEFFTDLALAAVGRRTGGVGKIAVVSSFLFGSVSGSAVANVAASGMVTIPMMKRAGYSPKIAGAIEALASTGGQLAPPIMGAAAFLMAEFLQIPYSRVVLAAIFPTLLYYGAIYFFVHNYADERNLRTPPSGVQIKRVSQVLRDGWQFITPFAALIYTLFYLNWRPEMAALAACAVLVVLAFVLPYQGRRGTVRKLLEAIPGAGRAMVEITVISAAAGMVIGVLNISGLSFNLTMVLVSIAENSLFLLLLIAALVSIVLGMGMPTVGVYVLLAGLVGPALVRSGVDPIAAHMFLLYFGMLSMITPPVALASYTAATISGARATDTAVQSVAIGWVLYLIPFLMVLYPELVLAGSWLDAIAIAVLALAAIWLANGAVFGYLRRRLGYFERLVLAVLVVFIVYPGSQITGIAYLSNGVALLLALAFIFGSGLRTKYFMKS